jgi:prephenate dehydratase
MTAAFQGEIGAYSQAAVEQLFPTAEAVPHPTFESVFEAVDSGEVGFGVIPIENSLFGSVHVNYDLLTEHNLEIRGEVSIRINHCLLGLPHTSLAQIRQVHSHPQALGQCRNWLRTKLPHADSIPAYDTAGAARMIAAMGVDDSAAIASERAAKEYGLEILARDIESNPHNFTRFLALARRSSERKPPAVDTPYKTTLVYSLRKNVPGALFKTLAVFALRDIDLFKIESRPLVGEPGRYLFYVDIAGHHADDALERARAHLEEISDSVAILGSYPVGPSLP